ncbi:MAG: class I SAM-dependent methyltransferase, partial [Bdellovibrionota bacterium]
MKIQILPQDRSLFPAWSSLLFQDVLKKQVIATLSRIPDGHIVLQDGQELHSFGDPNSELHARIEVLDARFYTLVALQGSVGGGEAFIREYWKCAELTTLVRILTRNRKVLTSMESGLAALSAPVMNFFHWLKRNTLEGSRRNIEAHYDLGNDFFGLFLDPTMMYSCAIFDKTTPDLESASKLKLERICSKLNLGRDDHILEIGTGWGSFAIYAA